MTAENAGPRLFTLGHLALLNREGEPLVPPGSAKLLAILAYLAASPRRRATRDQLVDLFWADAALDKARNSLRQSLHKLRAVLGSDVIPAAGGSEVVLGADLWTDRDAFLAALETGDLEAALLLYAGPFAPGLVAAGSAGFEQWADHERMHLQHRFAAAAEALAQRALAAGETKTARDLAAQMLAANPLDEAAWRLRLQAESRTGSRVHVVASIAELGHTLGSRGRALEPRTRQLIETLTHHDEPHEGVSSSDSLVADLVGRHKDLTQLYDGWRRARAGNGGHYHVIGAAGLGKSRLLEDFALRLRTERARVLTLKTTPRQRAIDHSALSALATSLGSLPGAGGISPRSAGILVALQPALAGRFPGAVAVSVGEGSIRERANREALHDLLTVITEDGPVALLVDDTHWWDLLSREALIDLIESLDPLPICVVTASRPGQGEIRTAMTQATLPLVALDQEQVAQLIQSLGDHDDASAVGRLAEGLHRAADGVPLLVIEAVRLGLDRGLLELSDGRWALNHLDRLLSSLHPGTMLRERIAGLSVAQREVLLLAAVMEPALTVADVGYVLPETPTNVLTELERLGMVVPHSAGWLIAHDVIRESVCAIATPGEIRGAHRRAGLLLIGNGDSPRMRLLAARHFVDADDQAALDDLAVRWFRTVRDSGDTRAHQSVLRDLLGAEAPPAIVQRTAQALPRSLRRRAANTGWRLAVPLIGLAILAAAFLVTRPSPEEERISLGLLQGSTFEVVSFDGDHWSRDLARLLGKPAKQGMVPLAVTASAVVARALAPDGTRWLIGRIGTDSLHRPELAIVAPDGTARSLADAPGEDAQGSWSPDSRAVVFATTRYGPEGDAQFDLAIVDVESDAVRRLTETRATEQFPFWSPDGTRIAFLRRPANLAPDQLCWIAVDGLREFCQEQSTVRDPHVLGWLDGSTVIVRATEGGTTSLVAVTVDATNPNRTLAVMQGSTFTLHGSGKWFACTCTLQAGADSGLGVAVFPVDAPHRVGWVQALPTGVVAPFFLGSGGSRPWVGSIRVVAGASAIPLGASYRLAVVGTGTDGLRFKLAAEVIAWTSRDTSVASIDPVSGELHPRRVGRSWVAASAGGWRTDSVEVVIGHPEGKTLITEHWDSLWVDRWHRFGSPEPRVESSADIARGFNPNGDDSYNSGALSRNEYSAAKGLGLEAEVSTPVTKSKWQNLRLGFYLTDGTMSAGGPGGNAACGTGFPQGEGWAATQFIDGVLLEGQRLIDGKRYKLLVQIFPDGSCGTALNGVPLQRTQKMPLDRPFRIRIDGQSVGTQILVGSLTVWSGVRTDVDWGKLGQDKHSAVDPAQEPVRRSAKTTPR